MLRQRRWAPGRGRYQSDAALVHSALVVQAITGRSAYVVPFLLRQPPPHLEPAARVRSGHVVEGNQQAGIVMSERGAASVNRSAPVRRRDVWGQLGKFGCVGASGYVVNLLVYALVLRAARGNYLIAATISFLFAVGWNYWWNRVWTFRAQRGRFGRQGMRFFVVAVIVYGANLGALTALVSAGVNKIVAQSIAVILVTPFNFVGNKLWSFRI